jgi:hypothetical protein
MNAALHVVRYLRGTAHMGLIYRRSIDYTDIKPILIAQTDADWATEEDSKSISGFLAQLVNKSEINNGIYHGNVISFGSTKQDCVTLSTAESEYVAAGKASTHVVWLRNVLEDIGFTQIEPTTVYTDNTACISMTTNIALTQRTKHIKRRYHYIRELIKEGILWLTHRAGLDLSADCLTKNLTNLLFFKHRSSYFNS